DDMIFSTIKVVSRHQNTQQYGAMLPIELMNDEIKNTKAYKEYYACATREAAPKPKASARRKMSGKQPAKAKSPSDPSEFGGSGIDEGTGSIPWFLDVPSDDLEEEISWNTSDDEEVDAQEKDRDDDEGDEKDEKIPKIDEHDDTKRGGDDNEESESDEESNDEETREEESFDPIPRTPEDSEDDGNGEEDQGL
nr:hypothetical protein [Tanacetum cinerariifolium]